MYIYILELLGASRDVANWGSSLKKVGDFAR